MRAYTLFEIDRMRFALHDWWRRVNTQDFGSGNRWTQEMTLNVERVLEDRLRTYMQAGISLGALVSEVEACPLVPEGGYWQEGSHSLQAMAGPAVYPRSKRRPHPILDAETSPDASDTPPTDALDR